MQSLLTSVDRLFCRRPRPQPTLCMLLPFRGCRQAQLEAKKGKGKKRRREREGTSGSGKRGSAKRKSAAPQRVEPAYAS